MNVIRLFRATCAEVSCGRDGMCLPSAQLDARGRMPRVNYRAYRSWPGFWTYVGRFQIYIPAHMGLSGALRRYGKVSKGWRPLCLQCIAHSYVAEGNAKLNGRPMIDATMFGPKLTGRLRKSRGLPNPRRAIERLVPSLEMEVIKTLKLLNRPSTVPKRKRRKPVALERGSVC